MSGISYLIKGVAAAALIAAPLALSAQSDVRTSSVPTYHLVQLSVQSGQVTPEDFKARTEAIQSCEDASEVAQSIGADFVRNRHIRATQMPEDLQDILKDLPAGEATPVFSKDGQVLRVLVLCART